MDKVYLAFYLILYKSMRPSPGLAANRWQRTNPDSIVAGFVCPCPADLIRQSTSPPTAQLQGSIPKESRC